MQGHGIQGVQGGGLRQAVPQANQATMALQKTIMKVYCERGAGLPEGLHYQEATRRLRTLGVSLSPEDMLHHIQVLCDEGMMYQTVGEGHHKPLSEDYAF
mmetsp:Transcript_30287/g.68785  ORF Transcript_30287/g.68785 Transcript_30287/m.68785 type:complete len:100 (+) Transcript_30287:2-301(+)